MQNAKFKMQNNIDKIKKDQFEIQKAIRLLVDNCLNENGSQKELKTDKPLVMHSLRVGLRLLSEEYNRDIVIAGILHDVLEDTNADIEVIENKFGKKIAQIVLAVTRSDDIKNWEQRLNYYHKGLKSKGLDAIIVSAADHWDNIDYVKYGDPRMIKKYESFLANFKEIKNEPIYKDLKRKYLRIIKES